MLPLNVLPTTPGRLAAYIRDRGPVAAATYALIRITDSWGDYHYGIDTRREAAHVGISGDSQPYTAAPYLLIWRLLRTIPKGERNHVTAIDYGCGKGRFLCAAACRTFREVIGVEYDATLSAAARTNVARMSAAKKQVGRISTVTDDAAAFPVPPEANVFYFFNPFIGETLARVVEKIRQSHERYPRHSRIWFVRDSAHFARLVSGASWVTRTGHVSVGSKIGAGIYETHA